MQTKSNEESNSGEDEPRISEIYARWTLNCIVDIAHAVAIDFTTRPRQYKNIPDATSSLIEALWYRYGTDPAFPDREKRVLICEPLIGPSDGTGGSKTSQFHTIADSLRARAWDFSNRQVQTGEDNLRTAFLDDVIPFQSYLETHRDNAVVRNAASQLGNVFNTSVKILTDKSIAGVFGRPPPEVANWPLGASFDENGARVIEEISMALETEAGPISQSQFIVIQRIAYYGSKTISGVLAADLNPKSLDQIGPLISAAYSWKTALDALGS